MVTREGTTDMALTVLNPWLLECGWLETSPEEIPLGEEIKLE
jgi:hypothetical protein